MAQYEREMEGAWDLNRQLKRRAAELEEQEEKNERTIKNMGLAIALAQEWTQEKDAKIAELEKELESSLYFNVDVVRCLSKIAWEHNHEDIPHYMNLAKQCIKSIESKQFKALKDQVK
tara:strand:+ start:299 stop:652 length:354 start_codon:yes stop_codon:yes gene_type:complete